MNEANFLLILRELWDDFRDPRFLWEVGTLAFCLLLAGWANWSYRRRQERLGGATGAGAGGVKRLFFPLAALGLALIARAILRHWMPVSLLNLAVPLLLSLALVRGVVYVLGFAFPRARWLAASERLIAAVVWAGLALYIAGLWPEVIDALEQVSFRVGKQNFDLWMILHGLVTVLAAVLAALWLAGLVERRLLAAEGIDSNLQVVLARVATALLSLLALLFSLSLVGIDITALSVFGGALAVGLGFGLQKIASNYVSGFIILLDRSIRIGNVITVDAQTSGTVTQITTRYTVVRTQVGTEFIIPNEHLVSNIVQNQSFTDSRVRLATTVGVAYDTDLPLAMRLMVAAAQAQARVLAEPPPGVLLTAFADSSINLELGFWIADPQAGTGNVRSDINLAIWQAFAEHGIQIPFPQREVRLIGAAAKAEKNPAPSGAG